MTDLCLTIFDRHLSSWSMRAWLVLRLARLPFECEVLRAGDPDRAARLDAASPSGKLPALRHGALVIWDSLAIAEYAAELAPDAGLWPRERRVRALARAVSAEMHAGFTRLRAEHPMHLFRRTPKAPSTEVRSELKRIEALFADCRARVSAAAGPYLFGSFSIADAMYAPVVTRFVTYDLPASSLSRAYFDAVLDHPTVREWTDLARADVER